MSPPTRQVAFNQALTRNDGLLVDALCQHLGLPAAEAREALRQAVAALYRDLQNQQRTELPGIGVFRQQAGRGLQFEYTGANDLLPAVFGLPELTVLPVSVIDARLAREQQAQLVPRLRSAGRGLRLRRVVPGAAIGLLAGLAVAGLYLFNLHPNILPTTWQSHVPHWEQSSRSAAPQQAALAQPSFTRPTTETMVLPADVKEPEIASAAVAATPVAPAGAPAEAVVLAAKAQPLASPAEAPAPADLSTITPASVALAATAAQTAPPQTVDPVDVMLTQRASLPSPIAPRARGRARKLPAAAAIAVANESNIARPIPMAMRKAGTATMITTSYAAARNAAPLPAPSPAAPVATTPAAAVVAAPKAVVAKVVAPAKAKWVAPAKSPARAAWPVAAKAKPAAPIVAKAKAKLLVPVAAKKVVAPAAPATAGAINARTGRYYVVVAAYDSRARAEQGRRNLLHAGHANAKIIMPYPGTRHYRLSAADYADRPAAQMAANQLRKNPRVDNGLAVFPY
ncbi:hypothetical protein A8B98_18335 [Hymenobacter sp. UV11]|nr:hypothetical protein A8B98_18335 [Hymenobacter sp. UV11]